MVQVGDKVKWKSRIGNAEDKGVVVRTGALMRTTGNRFEEAVLVRGEKGGESRRRVSELQPSDAHRKTERDLFLFGFNSSARASKPGEFWRI